MGTCTEDDNENIMNKISCSSSTTTIIDKKTRWMMKDAFFENLTSLFAYNIIFSVGFFVSWKLYLSHQYQEGNMYFRILVPFLVWVISWILLVLCKIVFSLISCQTVFYKSLNEEEEESKSSINLDTPLPTNVEILHFSGRPDFSDLLIQNTFYSSNLGVFLSGPTSMVHAVKKTLSWKNIRCRQIGIYDESFET